MTAIQRFLNQATRGLWGQKKRDSQAELIGAIEDKMCRYRLLGLNEVDAITAALRDLGSPAAIARELGEVRTLPQVMKTLLFIGIGATLSFQALAQVPAVQFRVPALGRSAAL
ncbi:permease prefix domain 1-containing protein [Deinococcus frigens]|uniref:permease prefix domain 1-containing protein n=1 Tax=Deinococcus frigens TaxID=249403 RepID=UPI000497DEF3|nr:permease prefix domain 1-containing protein [Deinococcus frigens]